MTDNKIAEVKKDIAELEKLQELAIRQKVKDILSIETHRLISDVVKLEERKKADLPVRSESSSSITSLTSTKCYQVKLNNYGWDQSDKFIKFYVTLAKVHKLPAENVVCKWSNKSLELEVKGLENKDYILTIKNLLYNIDPAKSSWKVKTDMVVIMAAKEQILQNWTHVTEYEKRANDSKKLLPDKPDDNADPKDSLMSMIKKMYDSGDDEMKRTIAKHWTQGQENKQMEL